ncbi:MAG: hypothetical protein GXO92_07755 [FCB group bacterium]|nr:hypothetical protein [FCB group bacterium]
MKSLILFLVLSITHGIRPQGFNVPGYECGDCHGPAGWDILELKRFNHQTTAFPLEGNHRTQPCDRCHTGSTTRERHNFSTGSTECVSCHLDIHESRLGNECRQCHGLFSWQVTTRTFDHEDTRFSLLGAHRSVSCQACHTEKPMIRFAVVATDCYDCHREVYDRAEEPSHASAKLPTDCEQCHPVRRPSWRPSVFNHDLSTAYTLTGKHKTTQCSGCHDGVFVGTPQDCWSCHQTDYELTGTASYPDAPVHATDPQFSENCELCHSTDTWKDANIDHNLTNFPLSGAHSIVGCNQCHGSDNYDLPLDCDGCHIPNGLAQTNYESAAYDHRTHNITENCQACHTTVRWSENIFDHLNFSGESCEQCHLIEYTLATDPVHTDGNIRIQCDLCHQYSGWEIGTFSHTTLQTDYELIGLHITVECVNCHIDDQYNGTPNSCENSNCHLSTFQSTTDPDHRVYGYPAEFCGACHDPFGWQPDHYDHTLIMDCNTCHEPDYLNATDPSHNGFPIICDQCHVSTTNWGDVNFDHTFPIYSGKHQGTWSTCNAECHIDPTDYSNFSCGLDGVCHDHDQTAMDSEHNDVANYVYESGACYDCHPSGGGDDDDDGDLRSWKQLLKMKKIRRAN